jgi:hypothetical protein
MASGHVNRTNRPNTWLHRPSLRRDDSPCQPGAVHTWHVSEVPALLVYVGCWGKTGRHLLAMSSSDFDPDRPSARVEQCTAAPQFQNNSGLPQGPAGQPVVG